MEPLVTVHRSRGPLTAEIARDLLEDAGLVPHLTPGLDALGETRVAVPASLRARAEAVLAAHAEVLAPDPEESEPEPAGPRPLRALLAAGVTPVCPGGGHFYARRPVVGGLILGGQLLALGALAAGGPRLATVAALGALGLFLYDVVGGQLAVRAENHGRRPSGARQATVGAVVLAVVGGVAALGAPVVERLHLGRRGAHGGSGEGWRAGATRPEDLPFPLHLDLTR
jgi:hypothetical protein